MHHNGNGADNLDKEIGNEDQTFQPDCVQDKMMRCFTQELISRLEVQGWIADENWKVCRAQELSCATNVDGKALVGELKITYNGIKKQWGPNGLAWWKKPY